MPPESPALIPDIVLQNDGRGSFRIVQPTAEQLAQLATWPESAAEVTLRDVDFDGREDIETFGVSSAIPGAFDQIVFAQNPGQVPSRVTSMNEKFQRSPGPRRGQRNHSDLTQRMLNPQYFRQTTFQRVVGVEPARKGWIGSVTSASNLPLVGLIANWCSAAFPNNVCGVSPQPPPDCIRTVEVLGPTGEPLGVQTVNVCGDPLHVYVYVPGEVSLVTDTSATDADARGTAEILESFNRSCDAIDPEGDRRIGDILRRIYGDVFTSLANLTNNSISHPYVPGDELFEPLESTFHHYDVRTQVCNFGSPNCDLNLVNNAIFRRFTYPSFQLLPELTAIDNVETRIAFITLPGLTSFSSAYVIPAGPIKQRRLVDPGFAEGGARTSRSPITWCFPGSSLARLAGMRKASRSSRTASGWTAPSAPRATKSACSMGSSPTAMIALGPRHSASSIASW